MTKFGVFKLHNLHNLYAKSNYLDLSVYAKYELFDWFVLYFSSCKYLKITATYWSLTLFTPEKGGGMIVPALTLDAYNFFNNHAKPTKLGYLS